MDFSAKIFVAKATQGNIVKRIMVNYQHGDQNGINGNGGSTHLVPLMPPLASSEGGDVPPQPPQQLFGAAATALHYQQQQQQQNCDEPMPGGWWALSLQGFRIFFFGNFWRIAESFAKSSIYIGPAEGIEAFL